MGSDNCHTIEPMKNSDPLITHIQKILIIAYKESTDLLEKTFEQEGFEYEVIRQKHQPEYKNYSASYLCLLNHCDAWKIATSQTKPTLIVEADFVPVLNFGQLTLPFSPSEQNVGIAWLYTCASQVYSVSDDGYAQGFSTSMVAYIVTPQSAQLLLGLQKGIEKNLGPTNYSAWDSTVDNFLRAKNYKNYIPFRNYGEHGGLPNREHQEHKLSATHRADVLYDKLAFTPLYVTSGSRLQLILIRLKARIKGLGRLFLGKYLRIPVLQGSSVPLRLMWFALKRQLFV